jgi:hypothetical protein
MSSEASDDNVVAREFAVVHLQLVLEFISQVDAKASFVGGMAIPNLTANNRKSR